MVVVRTKEDRCGGRPEALVEEASVEKPSVVERPSVEVRVSALRGDGLLALRELVVEAAYSGVRAGAETAFVTRRRQARAIRRALRDSEAFVKARDAGLSPEIAATHLLDAERAPAGC